MIYFLIEFPVVDSTHLDIYCDFNLFNTNTFYAKKGYQELKRISRKNISAQKSKFSKVFDAIVLSFFSSELHNF